MKYLFAAVAIWLFFAEACNKENSPALPEASTQNTTPAALPESVFEETYDSLSLELCSRVYNSEKGLEAVKKKRWPEVPPPEKIYRVKAIDPVHWKSHNPPE